MPVLIVYCMRNPANFKIYLTFLFGLSDSNIMDFILMLLVSQRKFSIFMSHEKVVE